MANHGRGRPGLIPLWAGEAICDAGLHLARTIAALQAAKPSTPGSGGIPELRQALADYHTRHFGGFGSAGGIHRHGVGHGSRS